ncbi:hypothetical protein ACIA8G_12550 [Lentzea sp. NPDC051213]|uniref:hypothetical protein n=1 Tax=Lentzea sp. NPDC051213 TaxID=3364126 RepID=UPI00378FD977
MAEDAISWTFPAGRGALEVRPQPWVLLRTTGFGVRMVERLATVRLDVVDQVLAERESLAELQQEFDSCWSELRDAVRAVEPRQRSERALRSCRRLVAEGAELDDRCVAILRQLGRLEFAERWNEMVKRCADSGHEEFERALSESYAEIAGAVRDDRFQHAVFVSNPAFHRSVSGRDSADRRTLDTLHRYLRRFATKCETVSFFGPTLYARLRPELPAAVEVGEPGAERVVVEASVWLVEELRKHATERLDPDQRRAWRNPLFRALPSGAGLERVVDGRKFRVAEQAMAVWQAADGSPLAASATKGLGPALTVSAWRLPATELHALTRLAEHEPTAASLAAHRDAYASAGWPERATHLAAAQEFAEGLFGQVEHRAGQHYADRELFHEDRSSPYSERVVLGGPIADALRKVTEAILPLTYLAALLTREDARDVLRADLAGEPGSLAALAVRDLPESRERRGQLDEVLRDLVRESPVLTSARLSEVLAPLWTQVRPQPEDACLPSPDLMAVGTDPESAIWVLSEMHDDCSSIYGGLERPLHSDPDDLWRQFTARVGEVIAEEDSATIVSRRRSAHVTPELPGVSIELSGLSAKDPADVVAIADVIVPASGDAVEVDGRRRWLYPGDLASTLHRAVSRPAVVPVPIDLGAHTPRITIDGVVYQRARWRVALPARAGERFDQWLAVQRIRRELGLPRYVFVKHPAEPKPLYVDFADPVSVLDLARLPEAEVLVSEMLPAPDQLWWRVDGEAQCAEFRTGFLVRPVNFDESIEE